MTEENPFAPRPGRRQCLQLAVATTAAWAAGARAQSLAPSAAKAPATGSPITIAQVADMSAAQQDVSRDFLIGSRAAWQDLNARGGLRGRTVQHVTLETDGTAASLQAAWQKVHAMPACVALSGCVGDSAAAGLAAIQAAAKTTTPLAQVAPWLHSTQTLAADDTVFDIFSGYQAQIAHALKTLASVGVQEIGVAFANANVYQQSHAEISRTAQALGLRLQTLPVPGLAATPAQLGAAAAQPMILFIGGTPELLDFTRRLVMPPGRSRYLIVLADVNLQTLAQMGGTPRQIAIIAAQTVPMVKSSLPVVRAFRETMARFYDEPATPQGLAGYIAARYTADAIARIEGGAITRASVLAALRRRTDTNIGGFAISYQNNRLSDPYVTQSILTADGRIVG